MHLPAAGVGAGSRGRGSGWHHKCFQPADVRVWCGCRRESRRPMSPEVAPCGREKAGPSGRGCLQAAVPYQSALVLDWGVNLWGANVAVPRFATREAPKPQASRSGETQAPGDDPLRPFLTNKTLWEMWLLPGWVHRCMGQLGAPCQPRQQGCRQDWGPGLPEFHQSRPAKWLEVARYNVP